MANDAVHIRLNSGVPTLYDVYGNLLGTLAALGGVTDHGALTGLADNDHPQYALAGSIQAVTRTNDGDYSLTSTSFDVLHASRFDVSFTLAIGDKVFFFFSAGIGGTLGRQVSLDIQEGSSRLTANDGGITGGIHPAVGSTIDTVAFSYVFTAIAARVHTFRPMYKVASGGTTIMANAVSGDNEQQITFGGIKL